MIFNLITEIDRDTDAAPPTFRQGQDRDRSAALLIAAASLLIVAGLGVIGVLVRHWAVLSYWMTR